jgi:FkbM family methyltransferase
LIGFAQMVRRFDVASTTKAYSTRLFGTVAKRNQWQPAPLRLKGFTHPVWIRPGTTDWQVLHQVFVGEEYSPYSELHDVAVARFYEEALAHGIIPVIVDCGANVGMTSIWYARRYPASVVLAIEPEPGNFEILTMNAENYPNIRPIQAGICDRNTQASLVNDGDAPWAWETKESATGDVAMVTIPDLLASDPKFQPFIVKIDIEGGELELFRSNLEWVQSVPLIVFESHDRHFPWKGTFHAIASALIRQPHDYIWQGENTFAYSHALLVHLAGNPKPLEPVTPPAACPFSCPGNASRNLKPSQIG